MCGSFLEHHLVDRALRLRWVIGVNAVMLLVGCCYLPHSGHVGLTYAFHRLVSVLPPHPVEVALTRPWLCVSSCVSPERVVMTSSSVIASWLVMLVPMLLTGTYDYTQLYYRTRYATYAGQLTSYNGVR
jgi:hypothetical protein